LVTAAPERCRPWKGQGRTKGWRVALFLLRFRWCDNLHHAAAIELAKNREQEWAEVAHPGDT
jgi:hypothetical protein